MEYTAICFSDEKYEKTRKRYALELQSKEIFKEVIQFSPGDFDDSFIKSHGEFIKQNSKGYGYFIWKPYFINKVLEQLKDGDILVYGDAGNEIKGDRKECLQIFNKVNNPRFTPILAARVGWNIRWTKTDLFLRMGFKFHYALKQMVEANRIVIKKSPQTIKFVKEWSHYCTKDYRNIDESESILPKLPFFIQHRYDQSVFSILFNKYHCQIVDFGNTWTASRLRY